ncbi:phage major tail tube protein [Sphingomonas koreensis]|uniref:phage major tail tube protein n=1 Tax=Sphingomonas koreensis TaxID=93064 RepID=UPI000F7E80DB|nr:phage major tail tube protein [Sphingomonas koreensis]MDC7808797.1 phage major tail tube protein [Sphingomonas koreensis]RSU98936.1 phage major tail tube protein [Sphingomonas koreensis]
MLPSKLKNYNWFANATSFIHQVPEITLPKIVTKTEVYRGGGMLGELDVDLGLEKLELEVTIGGLAVPLLREMGMVGVAGSFSRFAGAYQEEGSGTWAAGELYTRGKWVEFDPGNAKPGDDTEWKFKQTASYLRWDIDGRTEVEIDLLNNIYRVGGVDRLAEMRAILGQ